MGYWAHVRRGKKLFLAKSHETFANKRETFAFICESFALIGESFAFIRKNYAFISEGFELIRESFALLREGFALICEKYIFSPTNMSQMDLRTIATDQQITPRSECYGSIFLSEHAR